MWLFQNKEEREMEKTIKFLTVWGAGIITFCNPNSSRKFKKLYLLYMYGSIDSICQSSGFNEELSIKTYRMLLTSGILRNAHGNKIQYLDKTVEKLVKSLVYPNPTISDNDLMVVVAGGNDVRAWINSNEDERFDIISNFSFSILKNKNMAGAFLPDNSSINL